MSTLVIKNLPEALHADLKARARRNHRSLSKEAIAIIEEALTAARPATKLFPPLELKGGGMLTMEEIEAAISEGQENCFTRCALAHPESHREYLE